MLATVAWEAGAAFVTAARPRVRFGRSAQCEVRFGHQPLADLSVPRMAGAVVAVDGRVGVDNLSDKVAFDVKTADGPLETVRPGGLVAPAGDRFEIVFVGRSTPMSSPCTARPSPAASAPSGRCRTTSRRRCSSPS